MNSFEIARELLREIMQLDSQADQLTPETALMGDFAEFNSLTIVGLMTGIEEQTGCEIEDDEITEEIFYTVGSLSKFIESKLA